MKTPPEVFSIHDLASEAVPGLGKHLYASADEWPTAAARLRNLDAVIPRSGPAWSDPAFVAELRGRHERLGAPAASHDSIDALADGASCVVTGQQPGLLGGPLYSAWKVLGAIALARDLSARLSRRVVPVYWCGADDSDFDEVRRVWCWHTEGRAFRGELARELWTEGQRVGSVRGREIALTERSLMEFGGHSEPEALRPRGEPAEEFDLGERAAARLLSLFAESGLVVVDARSEVLRRRGRDLFLRYASRHRDLSRRLEERGHELARRGWPVAFDDRARQSGLFALEGDTRSKLDPEALDAGRAERSDLAPSVLLRPLWQDEQLAPLAAVLGPGEIAYHAQLTPLYEELGVEAARPVSRPHVFLLPRELPWPESVEAQRRLIAGGVEASRWLSEQAIDPPDAKRLDDARQAAREVWTRLRAQLEEFLHVEVDRAQERSEQEFARVRTEAAKAARAKRGGAWSWGPDFLSVRGVPQERALCVATLPVWWGDAMGDTLDALAQIYVEAVDAGSVPAWVVRGGPA